MTQLTNIIEHRRPGLWAVAAGTRLYTVEIGLDSVTYQHFYRVTSGARVARFPQVKGAFDFCNYFTKDVIEAAPRQQQCRCCEFHQLSAFPP